MNEVATEETEVTETSPVEETWMFGGTRIDRHGKRWHSWVRLPAVNLQGEMWFSPDKGEHYAVGSDYAITTSQDSDGRTIKHGNPPARYLGRHENDFLRMRAEAKHKAIEARIRVQRMEAKDKRESALDEALAPLMAISAELHATERTAFLAYVIQKITAPW